MADAEAALGCRFPAGYAAYVERFGAGDLGHFLGVYPPEQVLEARADVAAAGHGVLVLGAGDLRGHAGADPGGRRRSPTASTATSSASTRTTRTRSSCCRGTRTTSTGWGPGLLAALEWMLGSGVLITAQPGPVAFEPWEQRTEVRRWVVGDLEEVATALAAEDPAAGGGSRAAAGRRLREQRRLPARRSEVGRCCGGSPKVDAEVALSHDESAPADVVDRVVAVLDRAQGAGPVAALHPGFIRRS